ncbi:MAG TPA: lysophospholipid acyltransferase family protein [Povalibacter sp.]|nr:lysophospholipid acyltransferase family protein [Povalibacter sp.]
MSRVFAENGSAVAFTGRSDAFYWRFVGTAISFAAFGLGALLLSLTVLPALRLLPAQRCQRASRSVLQRAMRTFLGVMRGLGVLTCEFRDTERLGQPGQLVIANHPTLIDAVFLIACTPQAVCVAKHAMFRSWLTRSVVAAAGYISNELTADMIEGAAAALSAGQCLIMFPEATRTRVGEPLVFQRGAANVGIRSATRVTPVYIRCDPITLTKGEPWYRIPLRRPHFSLSVGDDYALAEYRAMQSIPLGSRAFNAHIQANFEGELQRTGGYTGGRADDGSAGNGSALAG